MTARYHDEPDVILVAAAQRGERDALDALLRRHYPAVVDRCRRVLNNDADANDAAQNALVSVAKAIGRFDGTSSFTTWLYRVATNAALDEVRRRNRRPEPRGVGGPEHEDDAQGRRVSTPLVIDARATEKIESIVDREAINEALANIAPDFRAPLVLRDLCGLDYAEIAEVLQIPPGTVRSRIARGRASLGPHLLRSMTGDGPSSTAASDPPRSSGASGPTPTNVTPEEPPQIGNFSTSRERQRFHDGH
jgi:RNA polymerase sigma-70 factor, ECF subfamily